MDYTSDDHTFIALNLMKGGDKASITGSESMKGSYKECVSFFTEYIELGDFRVFEFLWSVN